MKLSISNIAWTAENDAEMYQFLQKSGYQGLEIAPTRIFPEAPYDKLAEAKEWAWELKEKYGLEIPSMQSIWYGHQEKIFGSKEERNILIAGIFGRLGFGKFYKVGGLQYLAQVVVLFGADVLFFRAGLGNLVGGHFGGVDVVLVV